MARKCFIFFPNVPRQVSLAGGAGGSQASGAKALGLPSHLAIRVASCCASACVFVTADARDAPSFFACQPVTVLVTCMFFFICFGCLMSKVRRGACRRCLHHRDRLIFLFRIVGLLHPLDLCELSDRQEQAESMQNEASLNRPLKVQLSPPVISYLPAGISSMVSVCWNAKTL